MRSFYCQCGSTLFFGSVQCVACSRPTAMCPHCNAVRSMAVADDGSLVCDHCHRECRMCSNATQHAVCNRGVDAASEQPLCRYCRLNSVVPDLTVGDNLLKWQRLEAAKHRVLFDIERIGLPIVSEPENESGSSDGRPVLQFEFKSSAVKPVSTGHADGLITIDIAEADSVHREQTRVEFGEPQRTLVGHFRHELGHYYWQLLVEPNCLDAFRSLFGDEREPSYAEAQKRYYADGAIPDWQDRFISAYSTMHPWEDFAETFAGYMDIVAVVETARHFDRTRVTADGSDFNQMLTAYRDIGIVANEFNRDMGLLDLVPEFHSEAVVEKLKFIDNLRLTLQKEPA
ncbi:zinc-binding metallopeptidase family protein [Rosistilla oblonga]|uniref:Zinc-ribbon domain-containing protein n=1 Tax=Rosistilla oblonga TaxID=2527990 RepID=A0A518IVL6_9BACT|nr:putative zinc-binding metallopeptidase [Rosistilla oblonga]QDV57132.1 hypothetical protein Mal33_31330 [Rosistilla oblonga]